MGSDELMVSNLFIGKQKYAAGFVNRELEGTTNRAVFVHEEERQPARGTTNIVVLIHEGKRGMTNQKGFVNYG